MTAQLSRATVAALFVSACEAELATLKPGNVHRHAAGHGMDITHFVLAARAAAPYIADPALGVGARVEHAVEASMTAAGCNTNLGILLLCAPLAAAAQGRAIFGDAEALQANLAAVLGSLDREDAAAVFRAIVRADPAGLGTADAADVHRPADVTLLEAMQLARDRDRIARAYITGFEDIFGLGLPTLHAARGAAESEEDAITTLHMRYLAAFPDSHIGRKHGPAAAEDVRAQAQGMSRLWQPVAGPETHAALLDFDRDLKAQGLNPGTTADLVVGTLYAANLIGQTAPGAAA